MTLLALGGLLEATRLVKCVALSAMVITVPGSHMGRPSSWEVVPLRGQAARKGQHPDGDCIV